MKIKINTKPGKLLLAIFVVAIFAGFGLVKIEGASAANCICQIGIYKENSLSFSANNENECRAQCLLKYQEFLGDPKKNPDKGTPNLTIFFDNKFVKIDPLEKLETNAKGLGLEYGNDTCTGLVGFFSHPVNCTLIPILKFMGVLLSASATIFGWIINAEGLKAVLSNTIIYEMWTIVRDALNISFILVLLFSAFCTVFQVEKFNYRNILKTLVIMALLVNFSFPITRVIIDFSNVLMYYFLQTLPGFGDPSKLFATIAGQSNLNNIIYQPTADTSMLIAAIIFSFILAVTFIVIALLLVIRTVALALIIIFSPIAFAGSIVPMFSKYVGQWWDNLFKYSFFGPIMIFMLYLAVRMMTAINITGHEGGTLQKIASSQSADAGLIASMAFYAVPLVILWMGIGVAQKMSIAGAAEVTGKGKKFMGWAGRWGSYKGAWTGMKATGIPGGIKQRYKNISDNFKKSREGREAGIASMLGVKGAREDYERAKIAEVRKKYKDNGVSEEEIINDIKSGDKIKAKAAAMEAAEKTGFGKPEEALGNYKKALESLQGNPQLLSIFNDKVRDRNIKLKIDYEIGKGGDKAEIYEQNIGNMSADQLAKQKNLLSDDEFIEHYLVKQMKSPDFVEKIARNNNMSEKDRAGWEGKGIIKGKSQQPQQSQPPIGFL